MINCARNSSSVALAAVPIAAPRRFHTTLEVWWVHLGQPVERACPFTMANKGGELLHIGRRPADGMESSIESGPFNLRFRRPPKPTLIVIALELELSDEH